MAKKKLNDGETVKLKSRNPIVEFDRLQMYFGEPYVIDLEGVQGSITLYSPKIGDVIRMGESKFYSALNIFITNTTSYRAFLWDMGIDWNEISDFELFIMLYKNIDQEISNLLFGEDLVWNDFELSQKQTEEKIEIVLINPQLNIEINYDVYNHIAQYLRAVFNIYPEEKITTDNILKQWYINKDKRQAERDQANKDEKHSSSIQSVISACVNHPGFKYKLRELREVGVAEFYDSVQRLQIYENTTALLKGMYSGMIDGKKIKASDYNFMKEITK